MYPILAYIVLYHGGSIVMFILRISDSVPLYCAITSNIYLPCERFVNVACGDSAVQCFHCLSNPNSRYLYVVFSLTHH